MERKTGRPTLEPGEPTQRVTLRLPESVVAAIDRARGALTLSDWLRSAIGAALGEHAPVEPAPQPPQQIWLLWEGDRLVSAHTSRDAARKAGLSRKAAGAVGLGVEPRVVDPDPREA